MTAVRQQITIAAPSRAVWRAITTEDLISQWWAEQARVDAREGRPIVLTYAGEEGEVVERGVFLSIRPTRSVEVKLEAGSPEGVRGHRISFQIGRDGTETKVHVVQSGGGDLEDEELRAVIDLAWKRRLLALRALIESGGAALVDVEPPRRRASDA